MADKSIVVPVGRIEQRILLVRGRKVIIDADLAALYGVTTKRMNEQVRRNRERFPEDFMFRLTKGEKTQVVANCDHLTGLKFSPVTPLVFTEHGTIMAASVLNTERAVKVSVYVVRAFVKLREMLATHKELGQKLDRLERKLRAHDTQIVQLADAIRELMAPPRTRKRKQIGYHTEPRRAGDAGGQVPVFQSSTFPSFQHSGIPSFPAWPNDP